MHSMCVIIAGTYWQYRQVTMGGVVRFTACDILREGKRLTHTHAQRPLAHARIRLPHGPQSSSKQSLPYELRCPELMTYSGPAAPAGDDRDMFGGPWSAGIVFLYDACDYLPPMSVVGPVYCIQPCQL